MTNDNDYEKRLKEYIETHQSKKASGFFGEWAEYTKLKEVFDKKEKESSDSRK